MPFMVLRAIFSRIQKSAAQELYLAFAKTFALASANSAKSSCHNPFVVSVDSEL